MTFYFYCGESLYNAVENKSILKGFSVTKRGEKGYEVEIADDDEEQQENLRDILEGFGYAWQEERNETVRRSGKRRFHKKRRSHAQKASW